MTNAVPPSLTRAMRRAVPAALAALALAGCGGDDAEQPAAASPSPTPAPIISTDLSQEPEIPQPVGRPPIKLRIKDIVKGKGPKAEKGDMLSVQYKGVAFSTGQEFDASWDRGEPFQFPLGAGQVIPGWDRGIAGMRVGGRRQLVIPPDLAYGAQGSPPAIGPDETLVFVVDLVKVG